MFSKPSSSHLNYRFLSFIDSGDLAYNSPLLLHHYSVMFLRLLAVVAVLVLRERPQKLSSVEQEIDQLIGSAIDFEFLAYTGTARYCRVAISGVVVSVHILYCKTPIRYV